MTIFSKNLGRGKAPFAPPLATPMSEMESPFASSHTFRKTRGLSRKMYSSWTTMPEAAQETLTLRFRVFHRGNCSPSSLEVAHFFASTRRDRVETILRQLPQQLIRARRSFEDARATGERAAAIIGTSRYLSIRCPQSIADASWPASAFSAAPSASTWARG